jgi:hypothetical protein
MTDWKVQGSLPPMTHDDWMVEFERYKLFPEWQQRKSMTLDEFKVSYTFGPRCDAAATSSSHHTTTPPPHESTTRLTAHPYPPPET